MDKQEILKIKLKLLDDLIEEFQQVHPEYHLEIVETYKKDYTEDLNSYLKNIGS